MNAFDFEIPNPWKNREAFSAVPLRTTVLSAVALLICALSVPLFAFWTFVPGNAFWGSEYLFLAVLLYLFVHVVLTARRPLPVTILLVTAFACVVLGGSFGAGAFVLSMIAGASAVAFLITACPNRSLGIALPGILTVAAFFAVLLITRSPAYALSAFAFLPAGGLLSIATLMGRNRTSAICHATAGYLLTVALIIAWFLYGQHQPIAETVASLQQGLCDLLISVRDEMLRLIDPTLRETESFVAVMQALSNEAVINLVASLFNLLPALICVVCCVGGYEAQLLLNGSYFSAGMRTVLTPTSCVFTLSVPAAALYLISFLISLFTSGNGMFAAVVDNLCLILLPACFLIGLLMMISVPARMRGGARVFAVLVIVFVAICSPAAFLYLIALWGAYGVLASALRRYLISKGQGNGQDPGNPPE